MRRETETLKIASQKADAGRIFDGLIQGQSTDEILTSLQGNVSLELQSILTHMGSIGDMPGSALHFDNWDISVVIPHHNHVEYLGEALTGLASQTDAPNEVIVVDDCSADLGAVEELCKSYVQQLNLKLIRSKKRLYAGGARQLGAEQARGGIVVMHDADDVSHPRRIEATRNFLENIPRPVN
jgi:hypothetical protein